MHSLTQPLGATTLPATLWASLRWTEDQRQQRRRRGLALLRQHARGVAAAMVGLAAVAEVGLRLAGAIDFPLYQADREIGYLPRADQSGRFLLRHDWAINAQHQGTATPFAPASAPRGDWLLIGDSIVFGGNPYAAHERLGAQLQQRVDAAIWPVSAGGWSLQNQMAYLQRHDEVAASAQTLAFVLNRHDFAPAASWSCAWTHPLEKPRSALWHVAAKYVLKRPCEGTPAELQVPPQDPRALLHTLRRQSAERGQRVVFFLYPEQDETRSPEALARGVETMEGALREAGFGEIVSVGRQPQWAEGARLYRDGIHPTPEGLGRLAEIVAATLQQPAATLAAAP